MAYNIKVKNGIAFNLDDTFQLEQYTHICKIPNVSAYLKRLIAMDMIGARPQFTSNQVEEVIEKVVVNDDMMLLCV